MSRTTKTEPIISKPIAIIARPPTRSRVGLLVNRKAPSAVALKPRRTKMLEKLRTKRRLRPRT